jgi:hypothetical protein
LDEACEALASALPPPLQAGSAKTKAIMAGARIDNARLRRNVPGADGGVASE